MKKRIDCINNLVNEVGKDYIIIHERGQDNVARPMYPINRNYFESDQLPVINVHGREGHILDYTKILQNAKEIHVYEGSFMNLADAVVDGSKVPLYGHLYCKQHYFDPHLVHNQIIQYIKIWKMAQKQMELFMGNIGNTNMKLGVIGIGAVGSAISKGFEYIGHEVVGYDIKIPETSIEDTLDTEINFITVGTPTGPNQECDLTAVNSVIGQLSKLEYKGLVALKSTIELALHKD